MYRVPTRSMGTRRGECSQVREPPLLAHLPPASGLRMGEPPSPAAYGAGYALPPLRGLWTLVAPRAHTLLAGFSLRERAGACPERSRRVRAAQPRLGPLGAALDAPLHDA